MEIAGGDEGEPMDKIRVGIAGACARGGSFKLACDAMEAIEVVAVCDVNRDQLPKAAERLGARLQFTDYDAMIATGEVNAVVIGTPMQFHAPQAIAALKRDIHVLSEVTAGISIEECRELTQAAHTSNAIYMMAENYTYMRPNVLVRELVRRGLFGTPYFGEGEYLHELKGLNEITVWRRKWQNGVEGITYGTHSLGPILQWMPGDRVISVCCAGSGHHYRDPRGDAYAQDTSIMMGKLRSGGLVKIRVDMISDRPHAMTNYQLQGTDGSYESSRNGPGDVNKLWLRALSPEPKWFNADDPAIVEAYMPEIWRNPPEEAKRAGHGGGDYFEVRDWADAILGVKPCPIGIDEAMDMSLPGLVSQQSVLEGGMWIDVPDSREW
ncbi:MAG: hypothetical protein A2269_07585 [Lentisphaerae bacterium RIFOXYA12_FULL_60_10]|nr:MAG: hypothetical protein A2269_07585 [Lentisphaerae bacterium RIFOXYA12_FULL_60_10]